MPRIDNLNANEGRAQAGRQKAVETMAPLGSTAVGVGRTRFIGNESLLVEGSQKVSGWLVVTGTLKIVGTFLLEGITTITGAFALKGPATFEGDINQTGNYTMNSPGKITVAGSNPMTLGVGAFGLPGVGFASGGGVSGYASGAFLHGGSNTIGCIVTPSAAQLSGGINNYITASASKVSVSGAFETTGIVNLNNLPTTPASGKTPNLWIDSAGKIWKLV